MAEKAQPRKIPSRRHDEHQLRRRAHRNTAKEAHREQNKDTNDVPVFPSSRPQSTAKLSSSYWELHRHKIADKKSLRQYRALTAISHIRIKGISYPDASLLDSTSKYFWTRIPRVRWAPLFSCAMRTVDPYPLLQLQEPLQEFIALLYSQGIAYQVRISQLFPFLKSDEWRLLLGAWWDAEIHTDKEYLQTEEWKARETAQYDEINRIFAQARKHHHNSMALKKNCITRNVNREMNLERWR